MTGWQLVTVAAALVAAGVLVGLLLASDRVQARGRAPWW